LTGKTSIGQLAGMLISSPNSSPTASSTTTDVTKVGTLVADIFDGQAQKLIWRGKQSDAFSGNPKKK
jgi:hypothetical protein